MRPGSTCQECQSSGHKSGSSTKPTSATSEWNQQEGDSSHRSHRSGHRSSKGHSSQSSHKHHKSRHSSTPVSQHQENSYASGMGGGTQQSASSMQTLGQSTYPTAYPEESPSPAYYGMSYEKGKSVSYPAAQQPVRSDPTQWQQSGSFESETTGNFNKQPASGGSFSQSPSSSGFASPVPSLSESFSTNSSQSSWGHQQKRTTYPDTLPTLPEADVEWDWSNVLYDEGRAEFYRPGVRSSDGRKLRNYLGKRE